MERVAPATPTWQLLERYVKNGQFTSSAEERPFVVHLTRAFVAKRTAEEKNFMKASQMPNRFLLWHGARLSSWAGVLSLGLRVPPAEAPVVAAPFGKGLYFTDVITRAVQ